MIHGLLGQLTKTEWPFLSYKLQPLVASYVHDIGISFF